MRWFVAAFLLSQFPALACFCLSQSTPCSLFPDTEVVFVGRVIRDSGEGWGSGPARVAVEEVLHGLPKDLREVEVDTAAGTDCYRRLVKDERYVIYAGRDARHAGVLRSAACSATFRLHGNERLLEALRHSQADKPAVLVGKIHARTSELEWDEDGPSGVRVVAEGSGQRQEAKSGSNGEFEFTAISPGTYRLTIASPDFFMDPTDVMSRSAEVTLNKTGCGVASLYLWPNGKISGRVSSAANTPLEGVPVQVFAFDAKGALETQAVHQQKTDAEGKYLVQGLPPGDYVVGVNAEKYRDRLAYAPLVYPGTPHRDEGARVQVARGATVRGINLTLGEPREPTALTIEMVYEDGTQVIGAAGANIEDAAGEERFFLDANGRNEKFYRLDVYRGEVYQIRAHNYFSGEGASVAKTKEWHGQSGLIVMDAAEKRVRIVLHEGVE